MVPSAAELVARYLKTNGYTETLSSFIKEAGLPPDAGAASSSQVTIEQILQEKKTFDLSLNFEKLGVDDGDRGWRNPAPSKPIALDALPTRSNILSITLLDLILPTNPEPKSYFAVTTADRRLHLIDPASPSFALAHSYSSFQDSPLLDLTVVNSRFLLAASMSGKLLLYDTAVNRILDERKDHSKYLVKLATWSDGDSTIVASAGWDAKVFLYQLNAGQQESHRLGEPVATITLPSIPETLLFIRSPDTSKPILLLTRRDSTFLYYYAVPSASASTSDIALFGKQNLAPHSTAWVAFSPSDVQACPADPSIVAVATSSTPHMKLLVLRLLIPPEQSSDVTEERGLDLGPVTQASQSRAAFFLQDREEAAILININTMASQTVYSTPRVVWRPDGTGLYVSSDDGIVRGFEASTGKLVASLEGHEPGSKLRCLWAGLVKTGSNSDSGHTREEEILLSGGFDQKLIVWSTV